MSPTSSLISFGLCALSLLSCRGINPSYCAAHPDDVDCAVDAAIDGGMAPGACTTNAHCMAPAPVCEVARSTCVQCTAAEPGACGGAVPVCGADNACRACALDAECASMACLPDGACAAVGSVLYAAPDGGSTANCTPTAMCTLGRAVELVDRTRATIRLAAGHYAIARSLVLTADVRIVGRDAAIDRDAAGNGATLTISDGTTIELDYLTVQGGDGDDTGFGIGCSAATLTGHGLSVIDNDAAGIQSVGCAIHLAQARIAANQGPGLSAAGGSVALARSVVMANQRGGIVLAGPLFDLQNNIIAKNGNPNSAFGGVLISQITAREQHVLAFNTVAQNQATVGSTPGVICSVVATPLTFSSNIVYGNAGAAQVEGASCVWQYSDIGPMPVVGTGNLASEPMFVAPAQNNFHLQPTSPLRDVADPDAELADDIDGDPRPQGDRRDMGADEIK